jgi:hypothetical protein
MDCVVSKKEQSNVAASFRVTRHIRVAERPEAYATYVKSLLDGPSLIRSAIAIPANDNCASGIAVVAYVEAQSGIVGIARLLVLNRQDRTPGCRWM